VQFATATDVGRVRTRNEDFVFAGHVPERNEWVVLVVADGLGGHAGGQWASRRGVERVVEMLGPGLQGTSDVARALADALEGASTTLYRETREGKGPKGAGTTLVAALVREGEYWWANIGDSRLYHLTNDGIVQISADHSWVQEQVAAGVLTQAEAERHQRRNIITRAAGLDESVLADFGGPHLLGNGEALVLCSDGISGVLSAKEIEETVRGAHPEEAAAELVRLGNAAGGPDNLTVAIYRAE
jgi:PPM family protein phosphatase